MTARERAERFWWGVDPEAEPSESGRLIRQIIDQLNAEAVAASVAAQPKQRMTDGWGAR